MSVLEAVIRSVAVVAAFLVLPLLVGQTEHKFMAHMQGRLGPMYAGGWHGWAQLIADAAKFVQKEDVIPAAADRGVFRIAPAVALIPYMAGLAFIPIGDGIVGADVPASAFAVLAALGVGILGHLMGGWASANKYSMIGAMRGAAQLVAYELPMVLAVASVALAAGTLSLSGIVEQWQPWWLLWQLPGGLVFLVAACAETTAAKHASGNCGGPIYLDRRCEALVCGVCAPKMQACSADESCNRIARCMRFPRPGWSSARPPARSPAASESVRRPVRIGRSRASRSRPPSAPGPRRPDGSAGTSAPDSSAPGWAASRPFRPASKTSWPAAPTGSTR